jgi:RHS repeat-associated protein
MGRIAQQMPNGLQYFLPDTLGSARQLTDATGATALAQSFDPYGGLLSSQGAAASPYGYAGEWGDASGMLYLRARYYLPQAGIFTARDPFPGVTRLPVTLQPYLYAAGNPLRYTDPSGQFIFLPLLAVAAAGGLIGGVGYYALQTNFSHDPCARWEWKDAVFWGGVGTGIGALLGVGIYGGWWVGVQAGWWGAAATGGTSAACAYGDCLSEVVAVEEGVHKGLTVLGRYPNYLEVAEDVGGNAFNVSPKVWESMNTAQQWAFNQKFLDDAVARGDYFYLASKWTRAPVGTFFRQELDYLFSKGYTLSLYQNYLIPPSIP